MEFYKFLKILVGVVCLFYCTAAYATTGDFSGTWVADVDGKIEGDRITFYTLRRLGAQQLKGTWEGKIVGDEIHFNTEARGNKMNFVAKKIESSPGEKAGEEVILPPTVDPTGSWRMEVDGSRILLVLKAVGMSLTGTLMDSKLGYTSFMDGKVSGDTISFFVVKRIGRNGFRIQWKGKVVGKEIHFEGSPHNQVSDVIAKKVNSSGNDRGKLDKDAIKLTRDYEINNKKVRKKYNKLRKKDSEYDSAMDFFDKYRYYLALPLLEQLSDRLPDDAVMLDRLGVCLIMQSVFPADRNERKDMRARARGLLVKAKKQGMEDDMLEYYLRVIPEDGGEDDVFSEQKEVEESLTDAENAFKVRDFQKSILLYARTMEMDPTNYKAVMYVGDSYFAGGQYRDAVEWFDRATKVDPNKETAWRYWGGLPHAPG